MMGQTVLPIYPRTNYGQTNVYYKDSNNVYDLFVGTWTFTEGDISFTITLGKKVNWLKMIILKMYWLEDINIV